MIKSLLLVVWLLLASAVARDSSAAVVTSSIRRELDDGDSWPIGTKVYQQFDGEWYEGTITDMDDLGYTITWEDDSVDADDFEDAEVDQMVANYQTMVANNDGTGADPTAAPTSDDDSWPIGTKVYQQFEDRWYEGTITDMDDLGYTITWDDASVDADDFSDDEVDQMVANYQTMVANKDGTGADPTAAPTQDDSWPIGTKVYQQFDGEWYEGTITDMDDLGYTITWEDDSVDADDFSDDEVDQMVANYQTMVANNDGTGADPTAAPTSDDDSWPIGTKVYQQFEDRWYEGTITDMDDDGYTITWDDDSVDVDDFDDGEVDQMVANYQTMVANAGSGSGGVSRGGTVVIVIVVLLFAFVGVFWFVRKRNSGKEEMQGLSPTHGSHRDSTAEIS